MSRGHDVRGILLHVSAGVGMEQGAAPQIRFRCRPEVCVLRLAGSEGGGVRARY